MTANNAIGRVAATACAAALMALAVVGWLLQSRVDQELLPALRLLGAGGATWAAATMMGLFGPAPAERVVLGVLAIAMLGLLAGGGWLAIIAVY